MLVGSHVPTNFQMYRQNSEKVCERASLENFGIFTFLKLLFLSIFCRYIRYFVGTNDMLVGSHVPTNFQMYRQNSEKALLGGSCPPPPPPLATLMTLYILCMHDLLPCESSGNYCHAAQISPTSSRTILTCLTKLIADEELSVTEYE